MTTPAKYCCTIQQSKRLRELGVDAPSMFTHYKTFRNEWSIAYSTGLGNESYPAYTVGELGEMLPSDYCTMRAATGTWWAIEDLEVEGCPECGMMADYKAYDESAKPTEAECRAAMLIYLLENSLITPHK